MATAITLSCATTELILPYAESDNEVINTGAAGFEKLTISNLPAMLFAI